MAAIVQDMEPSPLAVAVVLDPLLEASEPFYVRGGLNVVYGLNGAGKTRLITGIRNGLRGIWGDARVGLLVRATREEHEAATAEHSLQKSITTAIAKSIAEPEDFRYFTRGKPVSSHPLPPKRASELVDEYLLERLPETGEARDWALANRLFILIPVGTENSPAWEAWAVADPGLDWVRDEEARLDDVFQQYDRGYIFDDDDDYDEAKKEAHEENYREAVADATLFPNFDREVFPSLSGHVWGLGPYCPLGYGFSSAASLDSIIITGDIDFGFDLIDHERSALDATAEYLRESLRSPTSLLGDRSEDRDIEAMESAAAEKAEALSLDVTNRLRSTLLDGPFARLRLTSPTDRLFTLPFEWRFSRRDDRWREVSIDKLSRAEKLWAERAIIEAVHAALPTRGDSLRPTLHIYDEPESALHRSAESHMARSLVDRASDPRNIILVATHSPELLDASSANVVEVRRSDYRSFVQALHPASREALGQLGLNPSDLLRLTRVFLLVEGLHDQVLLEHFLGDRLRRARVDVIPLRGGKHLAGTADSRVLFDYTNAHVVALLDNTDVERVSAIWQHAVEAAATDDIDEARRIVTEGIGYGDGESQYLTTWLTRALDYGLASRLTPQGLPAADIIEYLPVERVVAEVESWDELHRLHSEARSAKSGVPRRFKDWLTQRYGVTFGEPELLEYAAHVDVPRDFERLMKSIEAISGDR